MRILALDSSGLTASVAAVEDEQILFEYTMNYKKTHSQTLLPMLDEAVSITGMPLESVDAIAVAGGPGSFTGLRIGSATAKGLGLALDKPLIHVPTVDAMAYRMFGFDGLICPVMDARRNQVYTGIYRFKNDFETVKEQMAEDISVVIEMLNDLGERVVFLGDGVPVYRTQIEEKMQVPYVFAHAAYVQTECCSSGGPWPCLCERRQDGERKRPQAGLSQNVPGRAGAAGAGKGTTT